jgi:tight adherence protein B
MSRGQILLLTLAGLLGLVLALVALWRESRARRVTQARLKALHEARLQAQAGAPESVEGGTEGRIALFALRSGLPQRLLVPGVPLLLLAVAGAAFATLSLELAGLAVVVAGLLVAGALRFAYDRRQRALQAALPGFLDAIRQQILIGASVPQALQRAVGSAPPVLQGVFQPAGLRVQAGAGLSETLSWVAQRHGNPELAALAAAVTASVRYGGRLAGALSNLAEGMRSREKVAREMHAATAEVRMSSIVLALLPLGVGAWMLLTTPGYREYYADPAQGRSVLHWLIGLYILGVVLLRQIARPRY